MHQGKEKRRKDVAGTDSVDPSAGGEKRRSRDSCCLEKREDGVNVPPVHTQLSSALLQREHADTLYVYAIFSTEQGLKRM